jgi:hypothetical protein
MEERYIKAIDPNIWIRPAGWPAIPTNLTNKTVGIYAVYPTDHNQIALNSTFTGSINYTIDWGDGSSPVTVTDNAIQVKDYNYSTLAGPIFTDSAGLPYKVVKIELTLVSGTPLILDMAKTTVTAGTPIQSQWLELVHNWTANFIIANKPRYLQRLSILNQSSVQNGSSLYTGLSDLRVLDFLQPGNTFNWTSTQSILSNIGPVRMGDLEVNRTASNTSTSFFTGGQLEKIGNVTQNNTGNCSGFFNACSNLEEVGNFTCAGTTTISTMFQNCASLRKLGLINIGTGGTCTGINVFNNCTQIREIRFVDASKLSSATDMFASCSNLTILRMPNIAISFSILNCNLQRQNLIDLFDDLADLTSLPPQTITITGNPGVPDLTLADENIAVNKGWSVTKV